MSYTLGIDIGTYESKGVIADAQGRIIASASRGHEMIIPRPGWAEHRADEDWWGDFITITGQLLSLSDIDPKLIGAVACSAIGPCMLPVDKEGKPLMNGVLYGVDTRASSQIEQLNQEIGEQTILKRCGNALTSQSVGPKILWLRQTRPDIFKKTAKILTSTSYLTFKLTGNYVIDHYTAANFSPFYDISRQDWQFDLAQSCTAEQLPKLLWSTQIAGTITQEAAMQTGLIAGTPVTCGTIDAAAEAVSIGALNEGDMMIMYGSTIFIILITSQQLANPQLWHAPWLFNDQKATMAGLATSGTLTHWFRDHLARDLPRSEAFSHLTKEAECIAPGADGLICLPHFSGERTPLHDPMAKGAYFGLTLTHGRGHLYRATIEGIANATRQITDNFAANGQRPLRVLAVGGGTKNNVWLQATSDITGLDQIICQHMSGASYGNAFLAALALGRVKAGDITKWNETRQIIKARPHQIYEDQYKLFQQLYRQTKDIASALTPQEKG